MSPADTQAFRDGGGAPWRRTHTATSGIERYFRTIQERRRLIVVVTIVTTLAAILYLAVATSKYRAEADLLVSPVSGQDTSALTSLPLIRESSDPTRDVETAARLVKNRDVAARVKTDLHLRQSVNQLLGMVSLEDLLHAPTRNLTKERFPRASIAYPATPVEQLQPVPGGQSHEG